MSALLASRESSRAKSSHPHARARLPLPSFAASARAFGTRDARVVLLFGWMYVYASFYRFRIAFERRRLVALRWAVAGATAARAGRNPVAVRGRCRPSTARPASWPVTARRSLALWLLSVDSR